VSESRFHFVFAGGGTCGHLFPGLAVASRLSAWMPDAEITFVGSGKDQEVRLVQTAGHRYVSIPTHALPAGMRDAVRFVSRNFTGYLAARRLLREVAPSVVIGLGGYASGAVVQAAIAQRAPAILLEQNVLPGRANRWFAPSASLLCAAFDQVRRHLRTRATVMVTGNPVRPEFDALFHRAIGEQVERDDRPRRLVVLGGSSGARSLNREVPRALHKVRGRLANWTIVHQAGFQLRDETELLYGKLGIPAEVVGFINDVPALFSETDLVIGRAGGTSLAELAMAGIPAVLIPYPHAAHDHQLLNARAFARFRACRVVDERDATGALAERLSDAVGDLLSDDDVRARMGGQMRRLARPNAAIDVARAVCSISGVDPHRLAA
jgi:UDP-N-acetylglucosamine--N-acetylmuramyl-(pentapeptide) pyrophosphoryl-undecaprenol N-acetylglucosamine transferase